MDNVFDNLRSNLEEPEIQGLPQGLNITKKGADDKVSLNPFDAIRSNILEHQGNSVYDTGALPGQDIQEKRAQAQPRTAKLGAGLFNTGVQMLGDLGKGSSYLLDWEQVINLTNSSEQEFGNWFSKTMDSFEEKAKIPVYRTRASIGFHPESAGWWADQMPSLGSTVSLMIPAVGVTGGLAKAAKLLGGEKILQELGWGIQEAGTLKGITGAVVSRYMENTMEGAQTFQSTYDDLISKGTSEQKSTQIAAEAARQNWLSNSSNLVFDIPEYLLAFKTFSGAKKFYNKTLGTLAVSSGLQGVEEGRQFISNLEAQRDSYIKSGVLKDDNSSYTDRTLKYMQDPEFWNSAVGGLLGGAVFGSVAKVMQNKSQKLADSNREQFFQDLLSQYGNVLKDEEGKYNNTDDKKFLEVLLKSSGTGTLDKFRDHLVKMKDEAFNLDKEERTQAQETIDLRLKDLDTYKNFAQKVQNEFIPEELKPLKTYALTAQSLLKRRIQEEEQKIQSLTLDDVIQGNITQSLAELRNQHITNIEKSKLGTQDPKELKNTQDKIQEILDDKEVYSDINSLEDLNSKFSTSSIQNLIKSISHKESLNSELAKIQKTINLSSTEKGQEKLLKDLKQAQKKFQEEQKKETKETKEPEVSTVPDKTKPLKVIQEIKDLPDTGEIINYPVLKESTDSKGFKNYEIQLPDGSTKLVSQEQGYREPDLSSVSSDKQLINSKDHFSDLFRFNKSYEEQLIKDLQKQELYKVKSKEDLIKEFPKAFPASTLEVIKNKALSQVNYSDFFNLIIVPNPNEKRVIFEKGNLRGVTRTGNHILLEITDPETGETSTLFHPYNPDFYEIKKGNTWETLDFESLSYQEFKDNFEFFYSEQSEQDFNALKEDFKKAKEFNLKVNIYFEKLGRKKAEIPKEFYKITPVASLDYIQKEQGEYPEVQMKDIKELSEAPILFFNSSTLREITEQKIPENFVTPDYLWDTEPKGYFAWVKNPNGVHSYIRVIPGGVKIEDQKELTDRINSTIKSLSEIDLSLPKEIYVKQATELVQSLNLFIQPKGLKEGMLSIWLDWNIGKDLSSKVHKDVIKLKIKGRFYPEQGSTKPSSRFLDSNIQDLQDLVHRINTLAISTGDQGFITPGVTLKDLKYGVPFDAKDQKDLQSKFLSSVTPKVIKSWNLKFDFRTQEVEQETPQEPIIQEVSPEELKSILGVKEKFFEEKRAQGFQEEDIQTQWIQNQEINNSAFKTGRIQGEEPSDLESHKTWVKTHLPAEFSVQDISTLVHNIFDLKVVTPSLLHEYSIGIEAKGDKFYLYHEAFHAIFRSVLSKEHQRIYLNRIKRELPVTQEKLNDFRALRTEYNNLTPEALEDLWYEEKLADEYSEYQKNRDTYKGFWAELFLKILRFIQSFSKANPEALFEQIHQGVFKDYPVLNSLGTAYKTIPGLNASLSSQFFNTILGKVLVHGESPLAAYNSLLDSYNVSLEANSKYLEENPKFRDDFNKIFHSLERSESKELIIYGINKQLRKLNYSELLEDTDKELEDTGGRAFDVSPSEYDPADGVGSQIKKFISTTLFEGTDPVGRSIQMSLPWREVWGSLLPALSISSTHPDKIMSKLEQLAKYNPKHRALYDRIIRETGYSPETPEGPLNENLLGLFKKAFELDQNMFLETVVEEADLKVFKKNKLDLGEELYKQWNSQHALASRDIFNSKPRINETRIDFESLELKLNNEDTKNWKYSLDSKQEALIKVLNSVGINIHPLLANISTDESLKTKFPEIQGMTPQDINKLKSKILSRKNPFEDTEENLGLSLFLKALSTSSSSLDENTVLPSFTNPENKPVYSYSPPSQFSTEIRNLRNLDSESLERLKLENNKYYSFNPLVSESDALTTLSNLEYGLAGNIRAQRRRQIEVKGVQETIIESPPGVSMRHSDPDTNLIVQVSYFNDVVQNISTGNQSTALYWVTETGKNTQYAVRLPVREYFTKDFTPLAQEHLWNLATQEIKRVQGVFGKMRANEEKNPFILFPFLNSFDLTKYEEEKEEILKAIQDHITQEIKTLEELISTRKLLQGVPKSISKNYSNFYLNDLINTNAFIQLIQGDLGNSKDYSTVIKRFSGVIASGSSYSVTLEDTHRIQFITDTIKDSDILPNAKNIKVDDGQVKTNIQQVIKDLTGQRRIIQESKNSPGTIKVLQMLAEGKDPKLTFKEYRDLGIDLISTKQVTSGPVQESTKNQVHNKMSVFALTRDLTSYKEDGVWKALPHRVKLHNQLEYMEQNSISHLVPISAAKKFTDFPIPSEDFETQVPKPGRVYEVKNLYRRLQLENDTKLNDFITYNAAKNRILGSELVSEEGKKLREEYNKIFAQLRSNAFEFAKARLVKEQQLQYTSADISELKPNEIFVFGSNAEGVHGRGAALVAKEKFGAKQGQAEGLQGQSYAVITKKNWRVPKSSTLEEIRDQISKLLEFAKQNSNNKFLVTKLGSSLAGYSTQEIKSIFNSLTSEIPDNIVLPEEYEVRDSLRRHNFEPWLDAQKRILEDTTEDSQLIEFYEKRYDTNLPHISAKSEELFFSTFKDAFRNKVPGRGCTLVSSDGFQVLYETSSGKIIDPDEIKKDPKKYSSKEYKARDLKVYHYKEGKNKITAGEVLLTRKHQELANLKVGDTLTNEIFQLIGIRIPTQSYHSVGTFKVVGFLPDYYGDTVVAPKEIVHLMGADYDLDKLYLYMKSWYKDSKSEIVIHGQEQGTEAKFEGYIQDLRLNNKVFAQEVNSRLDKNPSYRTLTLKQKYQGLDQSTDKVDYLRLILGTQDTKIKQITQETELEVLKMFNLPTSPKELKDSGYITYSALYNQMHVLEYKIFQLPELKDAFSQPLSTAKTKAALKEFNLDTDTPGIGNSILSKYQANKSIKDGKDNLGIAVQSNSVTHFVQENSLELNPEYYIQIDGHQYSTFNYGDLRDKMDTSSTIVGAMADNANDPVAYKMNWNQFTVPQRGILNSLGVPLKTIDYFFQQEALKELSTQSSTSTRAIFKQGDRSSILKNLVSQYSSELNKVINHLKKDTSISKEDKDTLELRAKEYLQGDLKLEDLEFSFKNKTQGTYSDKIRYLGTQVSTLKVYDTLTKINSLGTFHLSTLLSLNRSIGRSTEEFNKFNTSKSTLINGDLQNPPVFKDIQRVLNQEVLAQNLENINKVLEYTKLYFIKNTAFAQGTLQELLPVLKSNTDTDEILRNFLSALELQMLEKDHKKSLIDWVQEILPNDKSLADEIQRLKSNPKYQNNEFLKRVFASYPGKGNKTPFRLLSFNSRAKRTTEYSDLLIDGFEQLIKLGIQDFPDNPELRIANRLYRYLAKDGYQFRNNSFIKFVPVRLFEKISKYNSELNNILKKDSFDSQKFKDLTGVTSTQFREKFLENYFRYLPNSRSLIPYTSKGLLNQVDQMIFEYKFIDSETREFNLALPDQIKDQSIFKFTRKDNKIQVHFPKYLYYKGGQIFVRLKLISSTDTSAQYKIISGYGSTALVPYMLTPEENSKLYTDYKFIPPGDIIQKAKQELEQRKQEAPDSPSSLWSTYESKIKESNWGTSEQEFTHGFNMLTPEDRAKVINILRGSSTESSPDIQYQELETTNKNFNPELAKALEEKFKVLYPEIKLEYTNEPIKTPEGTQARGLANIRATSVLIDFLNQNTDTLSHEFSHIYIAWFRDSEIVQQGIKEFGSEENLVQKIGEQVILREGKAYSWWERFVSWLKNLLGKPDVLKDLTNAFLTAKNLGVKKDSKGTFYQEIKKEELPKTKLEKVIQETIKSLEDRKLELSKSNTVKERVLINKRIAIIENSLAKLQEKPDYETLVNIANIELKTAEQILDKPSLEAKDVRELLRITLGIQSFDQKLAEEGLAEDIQASLGSIRKRNNIIFDKFQKKLKEIIVSTARKLGFNYSEQDIYKLTKDFNINLASTTSLDTSEIPLLHIAENFLSTNQNITTQESLRVSKEFKDIRAKYTPEAFKAELSKLFENGKLINPYSSSFFSDEVKNLQETSKVIRDKKSPRRERARAYQQRFQWYKDNTEYYLTSEGKALYQETLQGIKDANPKDPNQVLLWESENSYEYMGGFDSNSKLNFEQETIPKINGVLNRNWYRYLECRPIKKYQNSKYNEVKDNPLYKFIIQKYLEALNKVPHRMTLDIGSWYKSILDIQNNSALNKLTLGNLFAGTSEEVKDWFTIKVSLTQALGQDVKLTDEKGREKPLIKHQEITEIQKSNPGLDPLEILEKFSLSALGYEHHTSIQPILDLLLYSTEEQSAIKSNYFGIISKDFNNNPIIEANGLKNAAESLRYRINSELSGKTRLDESSGIKKITAQEISDLQARKEQGEENPSTRKFSAVKSTDSLIDYVRMNTIGFFKPFSALTNLTIGLINNSIEASKSKDFTDDDLLWASFKMYNSILKFGTSWVTDRLVTPEAQKIALGAQFFGISKSLYETQEPGVIQKGRNYITKFFYSLQEGGEYLIGTQIMLSMLKHQKITDLKNKERSLWEAYDSDFNFKTSEFGEHPEWSSQEHLDSNGVNSSKLNKFFKDLNRVRKNSQGDYSTPMKIKSKLWGRILMMYRTWLPRAIYNRFGAENIDFKGRYRSTLSLFSDSPGVTGKAGFIGRTALDTAIRVLNIPLIGRIGINKLEEITNQNYEEYLKSIGASEIDIQNMRANLRELQFLIYSVLMVSLLAGLGGDDDPEITLLANLCSRLSQDLSFFIWPNSAFSVIKDPIPLTRTLIDITDVLYAGMNYLDSDTYLRGKRKGESRLWKEAKDLLPVFSGIQSTENTISNVYNSQSYRFSHK